MDSEGESKQPAGSMYRPAMVNGFWPEEERGQAEAAAAELTRLGLRENQIGFSRTTPGPGIEYSSGGGLFTWIKGKLFSGETTEPEAPAEPVVLRTWPGPEQAEQVCEIMNQHGAAKVNYWESQGTPTV